MGSAACRRPRLCNKLLTFIFSGSLRWFTVAPVWALLAASAGAGAQTRPPTLQVPDCSVGTLADYEKLGPDGCKIGDVQFSGFSRPIVADSIPSEAVSITPGTSIDSTDPALLLEGPWTAKPQQRLALSYNVMVHPPAQPVETVMIQMQFGQTDGTGAVQIDAAFCPNAAPDCRQGRKLQLKMGGATSKKDVDQQDLPARTQALLHVTETVNLSSGKNGSAKVNGLMTVFELAAVKSK